MKRSQIAGAVFALLLGSAGLAAAQTPRPPVFYPPPFQVQPAMPETMPTWSRDELSGTAQHNVAATPGCGAANPQGGIPSSVTGTCP